MDFTFYSIVLSSSTEAQPYKFIIFCLTFSAIKQSINHDGKQFDRERPVRELIKQTRQKLETHAQIRNKEYPEVKLEGTKSKNTKNSRFFKFVLSAVLYRIIQLSLAEFPIPKNPPHKQQTQNSALCIYSFLFCLFLLLSFHLILSKQTR